LLLISSLWFAGFSLLLTALSTASAGADEGPKKNARILMVTQSGGFRHGSVTRKDGQLSPAERAVTELGISSGLFRVDCTQDVARDFTPEKLDQYDIVFFYTSGTRDKLPFPEGSLEYFLNTWLKQPRHGFVGTHAATDTLGDYQPYWDMIGGTFQEHPWGSGSTVTITVHDTGHPASKPWGEEFTIKDEIYRVQNWQPEKVRVLMSLNMARTSLKRPFHVPVAWVKQYGQGKVFYISLGHNEAVWANPTYMQSLQGGIEWILGHKPGDATPNPELSAAQEAKAKEEATQGK
jgi:type 1 glutamine amidotransferase